MLGGNKEDVGRPGVYPSIYPHRPGPLPSWRPANFASPSSSSLPPADLHHEYPPVLVAPPQLGDGDHLGVLRGQLLHPGDDRVVPGHFMAVLEPC